MESKYTIEEKRKHLGILLVLLLALFVLTVLMPPTTVMSLDGTYVVLSGWKAIRTVLFVSLVGWPIIAALVALGVAALPYKGLPWEKKYLRAWILSLGSMYALFVATGTWKLFRIYLGF